MNKSETRYTSETIYEFSLSENENLRISFVATGGAVLSYSGDAFGKKAPLSSPPKISPRVIACLDRPTDAGYIWPLE
jgi:hypothetical protein